MHAHVPNTNQQILLFEICMVLLHPPPSRYKEAGGLIQIKVISEDSFKNVKLKCCHMKKVQCRSILQQEICENRIKAGFFNVLIQDIAVHGTNVIR